nr:MAG TPA: hypothetical protein [Caudoviricetes sp.]
MIALISSRMMVISANTSNEEEREIRGGSSGKRE